MNIKSAKSNVRTDAEARSILKACGMSISKRDGEYRVAPNMYTFPVYTPAEREAVAYYSDDRDDAVCTAQHIAQQLKAGKHPTAYVERKLLEGYDVAFSPYDNAPNVTIVYGMTGGDWMPTYETQYYAQHVENEAVIAFASTYEAAIAAVLAQMESRADLAQCQRHEADQAAQNAADNL